MSRFTPCIHPVSQDLCVDSLDESFGGRVKDAWEACSSGKGPAVQSLQCSQVANPGGQTGKSKSSPELPSRASGHELRPSSCTGLAVSSKAPLLHPLDVVLWQRQPTLALGQTQQQARQLQHPEASKSGAVLRLLPTAGALQEASPRTCCPIPVLPGSEVFVKVLAGERQKGRDASQSGSGKPARLLV